MIKYLSIRNLENLRFVLRVLSAKTFWHAQIVRRVAWHPSFGQFGRAYSNDWKFNDSEDELDSKSDVSVDIPSDLPRILFPDDADPVLKKIVEESDTDKLFLLAKDSSSVKVAAQVVLTIRNYLYHQSMGWFVRNDSAKLIQNLHSHPNFRSLLEILKAHHTELDDNALTTVALCLYEIGLPFHDGLQQKLTCESTKRCQAFDLTPLSMFIVTLEKCSSNNYYLASISQACARLSELYRDGDLKQVARCVVKLKHWLSDRLMMNLESRIVEFLYSQPDQFNYRLLLKCLYVFTGDQRNFVRVQNVLVKHISPFVPELNSKELAFLKDVLRKCNCNTDHIDSVVSDRAKILMKETKDHCEVINLCYCLNSLKIDGMQLSKLFQDPKTKNLVLRRIISLAFRVRGTNVFDEIFDNCDFSEEMSISMLHLCSVYVYVSMDKQYRHSVFEKEMTRLCLDEIEKLRSELFLAPQNTALALAFVVAVLGNEAPVFDHLYRILPQISSANQIGFLSAATKAAFQKTTARRIDCRNLVELQRRLDSAITAFDDPTVSCTNYLIFAGGYMYERREYENSLLFEHLMNRYNCSLAQFSPVTISLTAKLLRKYSCFLPHVIDAMAKYITAMEGDVPIRTVHTFLQLCYHVGYCPQVGGDYLQGCRDVILRHHEIINAGNFLGASLALALFQCLNSTLIHTIFNVTFMDRLDKELSVAHPNYAARLQDSLVTLNRVACIDYPEEKIPWFHNSSCESQASERNHRLTMFQKEIYNVLCEVLPGPEFIRPLVYTPYHYMIHFECVLNKRLPLPCADYGSTTLGADFDSDKRHAKVSHILPQNVFRIAIIALPMHAFCTNVPRLKGWEVLRQRHLEILGYKVIQVPEFEWNSLQMSSRKARIDYLYRKIFNYEE